MSLSADEVRSLREWTHDGDLKAEVIVNHLHENFVR